MTRNHNRGGDDLANPMAAPAVFNLATYYPGLEHFTHTASGGQWLGIMEPEIPYPDPAAPTESTDPEDTAVVEAVRNIVLERDTHMFGSGVTGGQRYYKLPENYISMGQALNDSLGSRGQGHSLQVTRELFRTLGAALHDLNERAHLTPKELSYKQVVISRDTGEVKLLPPLELVEADQEALKATSLGFVSSCTEASSNDRQLTDLYDALQGLFDALGQDWRW